MIAMQWQTLPWASLATGCVVVLCATLAWYRTDSAQPSGEAHDERSQIDQLSTPNDNERSVARPISLASHEGSEQMASVESWIPSTDSSDLSRVDRIEELLRAFEDALAAPPDVANCHQAASVLSVLRAELIQQDGDRSRFDALETRYDAFAKGCESR